jgi:ABC-type phosphate/phosphonate transport system substrate-binding protein
VNDLKQVDALNSQWIAALPMYDFPQLQAATDAFWAVLADRLIAMGMTDVPDQLTRSLGHCDTWQHPRLLFGQGCEYPLSRSFANCVTLLGTPRYTVPGCEGSTYRSAIVIRNGDDAETLPALRNRRCVINEVDSNSGMNLLRAVIAPLSGGVRFFESVTLSGSHRQSIEMVAEGRADVAAIDCVTFAHLQRFDPSSVSKLRILCWTPPSPSLPFITARTSTNATIRMLRAALASVFADESLRSLRELLFLDGVNLEPDEGFTVVHEFEKQALKRGYPALQ